MWNWYLKENSAEKIGLEYMKNKYLFPSQKMFVGRKAIELQIWTCQLQQLVEHISISSTQGEAIARGEEESTQLERGDHRRWKLAVKGDKTNKGSHSELGLHSVYSCLCNLRRERERGGGSWSAETTLTPETSLQRNRICLRLWRKVMLLPFL